MRACGLTALELLVAMSLIGLLASLGIPALQNLVMNAQRLAATNGLVAAIQLARSTAAARNATITLCPSVDARRCSAAPTPHDRWIVVAIADGAAQAAVDRPLRVVNPDFSGALRSNRSAFEFRPFPLRSTNGTISLCDRRGGRSQRAIVISTSGRPRVAHASSEAGLRQCAPP
jgi:type IV fimbrial biogenesis protein FimT